MDPTRVLQNTTEIGRAYTIFPPEYCMLGWLNAVAKSRRRWSMFRGIGAKVKLGVGRVWYASTCFTTLKKRRDYLEASHFSKLYCWAHQRSCRTIFLFSNHTNSTMNPSFFSTTKQSPLRLPKIAVADYISSRLGRGIGSRLQDRKSVGV